MTFTPNAWDDEQVGLHKEPPEDDLELGGFIMSMDTEDRIAEGILKQHEENCICHACALMRVSLGYPPVSLKGATND